MRRNRFGRVHGWDDGAGASSASGIDNGGMVRAGLPATGLGGKGEEVVAEELLQQFPMR